jgi:hypothetical protein
VRPYLVSGFPIQERIYNQPLVLSGTAGLRFFGGAVEASSVVVKSLRPGPETRQSCTLAAGGNSLSLQYLVPGSVVLASDSSLGSVYMENQDYMVDYSGGRIVIKDGGALAVGQTVTVWFDAFNRYQAGSDYRLEAERGEISRYGSGDIADGEQVFLEYSPVGADVGENLLAAAVRDANALTQQAVDPDREFGADPVLVAATTYRAMEIVCRAAAVRELAGWRGQDRVATGWIKLAEAYAAVAERLLAAFRPPAGGPASPTHS